MSQPARDEYLEKIRDRYRRYSGKLAKTKLLDEFCQISGHERKYANKLLKRLRGPKRKGGLPSRKRGREKTYAPEVVGIVFEIWKHSEQPCGKRLAPMLKEWLPFYEKHYGTLAAAISESVLSISPAQIDRSTGSLRRRKSGLE
jgi:hypothetical protein